MGAIKYNRTYLGLAKTVVELQEYLKQIPPNYRICTYDGYIEFQKPENWTEYFEVETPQ